MSKLKPQFQPTAKVDPRVLELLTDPVKFFGLCWPDYRIYNKQRDTLYSLRDNDETIVRAGNMLGKDFIGAACVLWFASSRLPHRVITSSSGEGQLVSVLWGEMRRLLQASKYKLPFEMTHLCLRYVQPDGTYEPRSYVKGITTNVIENLQGHHLERGRKELLDTLRMTGEIDIGGSKEFPRTLIFFDECSSIQDEFYDAATTWAHRVLMTGNPLPCANHFYRASKKGDVPRPSGKGFYTKIIHISAEDSPNVISGEQLIPGLITKEVYDKNRATWDPIKQCVSLDGNFYEGAEVKLYPPAWLDRAIARARELDILVSQGFKRKAKAIGCDPGEGGDKTAWTVVDEYGLMYLKSKQTYDTSTILSETLALMLEYDVEAKHVYFDRGGGGKQHVDYARKAGYNMLTVAFGESATPSQPKAPSQVTTQTERREETETRSSYKNRRAEMYGLLRFELLDPIVNPMGFGLPFELNGLSVPIDPVYGELHRQLQPLPLLYEPGGSEGRMWLPPKDKKNKDSKEITLKMMLGCSPDEADALVLAVYGMLRRPKVKILTSFGG